MSPTHTGSSTLKPYRHFPMASLAIAIAVSACLMGAQASESSQPPASPAEISSQQTQPTAADYSRPAQERDRKSTRLNSSHLVISYAVFCLKKKNDAKLEQRLAQVEAKLKQRLAPVYAKLDQPLAPFKTKLDQGPSQVEPQISPTAATLAES